MTIGTVPAAGTSPCSETNTRRLNPGRRPHKGTALNTPARLTACSRPTPLPRSSAALPCTARTGFPPHASGLMCVPGIGRPVGWFTAHAELRALPWRIYMHRLEYSLMLPPRRGRRQ